MTIANKDTGTYYVIQPKVETAGNYLVTISYSTLLYNVTASIVAGSPSAIASELDVPNSMVVLYCNKAGFGVQVLLHDAYANRCPCAYTNGANSTIATLTSVAQSEEANVTVRTAFDASSTNMFFIAYDYNITDVYNTTVTFDNNAVGNSSVAVSVINGYVNCGNTTISFQKANTEINETVAGQSFDILISLVDTSGRKIIDSNVFDCGYVELQSTTNNSTLKYVFAQPADEFTLLQHSFVKSSNLQQAGFATIRLYFYQQLCSSAEITVVPSTFSPIVSTIKVQNTDIVYGNNITFSILYYDGFSNYVNACKLKSQTVITSSPPLNSTFSISCNDPYFGVATVQATTYNNNAQHYLIDVTVNSIRISSSPFSLTIAEESNDAALVIITLTSVGIFIVCFVLLIITIITVSKYKKLKRNTAINYPYSAIPLQNAIDNYSKAMMLSEEQIFLTLEQLLADTTITKIEARDLEPIKKIGSGASGIVTRAKWSYTDPFTSQIVKKDVAIKQLHAVSNLADGEELASFIAEIKLVSQLSHPNIVKFYGISTSNQTLSLVLEYLEMGSADKLLATQNAVIPASLRYKLLLDCASGMHYLHFRNIIHRDLKPANLLLGEHFSLKITDFGISTIRPENAMTMTVIGSPAYMAPEVLAKSKYTEKADVFSFGIVCWQILTGKWPYKDDNIRESGHFVTLPSKIIAGLRPATDGFPPITKKLLNSCWHADPAERPSFEQIITILQNVMSIRDEINYFQHKLQE